MIRFLDPSLKQIAKLVNRTKYTNNLVLDEGEERTNEGYPNRGVIIEHWRTSGILKTVIS